MGLSAIRNSTSNEAATPISTANQSVAILHRSVATTAARNDVCCTIKSEVITISVPPIPAGMKKATQPASEAIA